MYVYNIYIYIYVYAHPPLIRPTKSQEPVLEFQQQILKDVDLEAHDPYDISYIYLCFCGSPLFRICFM